MDYKARFSSLEVYHQGDVAEPGHARAIFPARVIRYRYNPSQNRSRSSRCPAMWVARSTCRRARPSFKHAKARRGHSQSHARHGVVCPDVFMRKTGNHLCGTCANLEICAPASSTTCNRRKHAQDRKYGSHGREPSGAKGKWRQKKAIVSAPSSSPPVKYSDFTPMAVAAHLLFLGQDRIAQERRTVDVEAGQKHRSRQTVRHRVLKDESQRDGGVEHEIAGNIQVPPRNRSRPARAQPHRPTRPPRAKQGQARPPAGNARPRSPPPRPGRRPARSA